MPTASRGRHRIVRSQEESPFCVAEQSPPSAAVSKITRPSTTRSAPLSPSLSGTPLTAGPSLSLPTSSGSAYSSPKSSVVQRLSSQIPLNIQQLPKQFMDSATPFDVSGGSGKPRSRLQKTAAIFCRQWPYIGISIDLTLYSHSFHQFSGFAIVLAVLNIVLALWSMSYLRFKKERALIHSLLLILLPYLFHSPFVQFGLSLHYSWPRSIYLIVLSVRGVLHIYSRNHALRLITSLVSVPR